MKKIVLNAAVGLMFWSCAHNGDSPNRSVNRQTASDKTAMCVLSSNKQVPKFKRMIVFGDSLSDIGSYAHAASKKAEATGRFTNHSSGADTKNWVDHVATGLGLSVQANRMDGFGLTAPIPNPSATALDYAQGGSRIIDPKGIGNDRGYSTRPVQQQVQFFLDQHQSFDKDDVVFVFAGANDLFYYLAANATNPEKFKPEQVAKFSNDLATQLADVLNVIESKGNPHIIVLNLPNLGDTPRAKASKSEKILSQLTKSYNQALHDEIKDFSWWTGGIGGNANHHNNKTRIINLGQLDKQITKHPQHCGINNIVEPVCEVPAALGRTSLFCGPQFVKKAADPKTYKFADDVHPTETTYQIFAEYILYRLTEELGHDSPTYP